MSDSETHFGSFENYQELIDEALEISGITAKDRDFLFDLKEKVELYGEDVFISDKQADWLRDILDESDSWYPDR